MGSSWLAKFRVYWMIHSLLGSGGEMPETTNNIALIGGVVGGIAALLLIVTAATIIIFVVVKSRHARRYATKG